MPHATFFNLKHKKRLAFIQEAYKEFALHPLEAASITNLVKSLGIAKGSVYQYFKDKEELHKYLLQNAQARLIELLEKTCPYDKEDFFSWYEKTVIVEVKFYLSIPAYGVLLNQMEYAVDPELRKLRKEISHQKHTFLEKALPESLSTEVQKSMLLNGPRNIFQEITNSINLRNHIEKNKPVEVETDQLIRVCTEYTRVLRSGI